MKNKLVSIIIPVYNTEKYLEECIKSVVHQTYTNIEIIIVDDGSTDNSYLIYNKYRKIDSRVRIIKKENGGLSDARNFGIKYSKGKYIFFLDSDDMIQKNTIEVLYNSLIEYDFSISLCNFEKFDTIPKFNEFNNNIIEYSSKEYIESILKFNNYTYACGVLIPKKLIEDNFFIKDRYFEDMASMYKIYYNCDKIIKVDSSLYKYRINPNSIVNTPNKKKTIDCYLSANEMLEFIEDKYQFDKKTINTFMCNLNRNCYIMSRNVEYLIKAKELLKDSNLKGIGLKYKIKLVLLKSITISKLIIKIKNT